MKEIMDMLWKGERNMGVANIIGGDFSKSSPSVNNDGPLMTYKEHHLTWNSVRSSATNMLFLLRMDPRTATTS